MPIEIKELHIRVAVNATPQAPPATPQAPAPTPGGGSEARVDAIVAECVEQVLQILREKAER